MKFGQALSVFEAALPEESARAVPGGVDQTAGRGSADADLERPPDVGRAVRATVA